MSKYLYRPHCGGLADAMKELKEFKSRYEMINYVYKHHSFGDEDSIKDITFHEYGLNSADYRIGWKNTYIVCSKGRGGCGWFTKDLSKKESLEVYTKWLENFKVEK